GGRDRFQQRQHLRRDHQPGQFSAAHAAGDQVVLVEGDAMSEFRGFSRRQFLVGLGAAPLAAAWAERATAAPAFLSSYHELAASERKRVKIRDVQALLMQGASRNYVLIKITSDAGAYGIGEGYGSPGVGVKEQVLSLKPWLVGKDPLEIDKLYTQMGEGTRDLSGTRTDGSAHNLLRA